MKGSFWKKNIKEMKKEKKERRIKQKILRMELEKTSSNELKSVVSDKKERQQEILQEEKVEPEPVEYCKFLLDTNILDDIFSIKEGYVVTTMMDHWNHPSREWNVHMLKFLTLDNIIDEFTHMRKHKKTFDQKSEFKEVCVYLSSIGKFECVNMNNDCAYADRARKLFESEKYVNQSNGKPLSKADCYLLEYAIEYSCKLVTHDKTLLKATKKEIRERVGENAFDEATSAGVFDPPRT
jgi:predicted nucleic acid-binding protein